MKGKKENKAMQVILKAVAVGMGVAVVALSCLKAIDTNTGIIMLGIGLACVSIAMLERRE